MDIKDLRGEDGSFSEDKVGDLINKFTDLNTKVTQFDEQKISIINDTKISSSELISCNSLCRTCWFTAACA
jgi:hypothetical protein